MSGQSPSTMGQNGPDRRKFLGDTARICGAIGFGGLAGFLAGRAPAESGRSRVWQIDPSKCTACGKCATECVLDISAVRCFHNFKMCGYCRFCSGYFELDPIALESGAENQLCPTGAILRKFVEEPYYEYDIDKELCIGCGKCVEGCTDFGNGSLFLQIDHDICVHCNECAIAPACPADAFRLVPADDAYLLKDANGDADTASSADAPHEDA